jgi:tetratricopeptide (TPR) repeat protein
MNTQGNADALLQNALRWVSGGDFGRAAILAEEAATLHGSAGRTVDQALTLQLAAALKLVAGDAESNRTLSQSFAKVVPENLPVTVASLARQADMAATQGRYRRAAEIFTASLDNARAAGLPSSSQIALLRRRAACRIAAGDLAGAESDFAEACQLAYPRIAALLRVEQSRLLLEAGELDAATAALPEPIAPDSQLLAELEAQKARLARAGGNIEAARKHATSGRSAALSAVAPVPYFTASVELAESLDVSGERIEAYNILTDSWATLSALLGPRMARSWVEPCLLAMRLRWGETQFDAIKQVCQLRRHHAPPKDIRRR